MKHFDIFTDISGKSSEILDLLGIDQRARFKHVHCPLPDHDDRHPSFRVDQKTERFICTCSPRGGSMIDLVIGKSVGRRPVNWCDRLCARYVCQTVACDD